MTLRLLLPLFLAGLMLAGVRVSAANESVWLFECEHFGSGLYRFHIAREAIRIESLSSGVVTVAKAPEWRVSCSSRSEKEEWSAPLNYFNPGDLATINKPVQRSLSEYTVDGEQVLRGLRCEVRACKDNMRCWVPLEIKCARQNAELVCRYFKLPCLDAVPVRAFKTSTAVKVSEKSIARAQLRKTIPWLKFDLPRDNAAGHASLELKSWRRVPYNAADFEYPRGYRRVKDLKEILISRQQRQDIEGLVDALSR